MSTPKSGGQRRREVLVDDLWLKVIRENLSFPDGTIVKNFYTVERPAYAAVVPLFSTGDILLVEQYRHGPRKRIWNVPMGVLGKGETPLRTAQRELREETGYTAAKMRPLGVFENAPSFLRLKCYLFLARGLRRRLPGTTDHTERVRLVRIPLRKAVRLVSSGKIQDMTTVIGILGASEQLRRKS